MSKKEKKSKEKSVKEKSAKKTAEYKAVSVGGWIVTLLLSAIPGLNLILWMIWAFAAKRPSRKSFAIALLILTLIFLSLMLLAACLYGEQILDWARSINPNLFSDLLTDASAR